ncbi:hypothetical protein F5884DRAFT_343502 [Xylogone sp. PMI_703]|nr:hypothetical protein F5884DRAFT_343502 [Xylogone sp. PMI_703]
MDYLPQVTVEPAHEIFDVPYLLDHTEKPAPSGLKEGTNGERPLVATSLHNRASILQQKYFFGLLEDLLQPNIVAKENFMTRSSTGRLNLSAASVPSLLSEWKTRKSKENAEEQQFSTEFIKRLLHAAIDALKVAAVELSSINEHTCEPLSLMILSIQALVETIWDAQLSLLGVQMITTIKDPNRFWVENNFVNGLLRSAGWLPVEIALMPRDIRFRYYLSYFSQSKERQFRRRSSTLKPRQSISTREHYLPVHAKQGCQCDLLESHLPPEKTLENFFCLVSLSGSADNRKLQIHEASLLSSGDPIRFVAFSHVRSDGLGSSTGNHLPQCQLEALQILSNQLIPNGKSPIPFYIDTLCIPLEGRAKRNALRTMQHVFRLASKVLVLDSDIQSRNAGLPQENLVRIRYSVWSKRLWTIQECAVAQSVSFRFKDQILPLMELLHSYENGNEFPLLMTQSLKRRKSSETSWKYHDNLSLSLALLSDDMQLAESMRHDQLRPNSEQEFSKLREGYDKWQLRKILRLGLLALPDMRYFPEANESASFETVVQGILDIYANIRPSSLEWPRQDLIIPDELYSRLKRVQAIELIID